MLAEHNRLQFVLNGNGPVSNRGCQAILFGTWKILEQEFGPCSYLLASFAKDPLNEITSNTKPIELSFARHRWSKPWWKYQMRKRLGLPDERTEVVETLRPHLTGCSAMFSIGGDNYAIDYGYDIVERLVAMNCCAQALNIPVIIWGASIGPFDRDLLYEKRMAVHLSQVDLIVVREPLSLRYLKSIGIEKNVVLAPDPAFAVEPVRPTLPPNIEKLIEQGFIGLNLSPMLAKYVTANNLESWRNRVTGIVAGLLDKIGNNILLIPHVTSLNADSFMDDAFFLESVRQGLKPTWRTHVDVTPRWLSCEQVKWVISRAEVFIGARTHATIAAFSTGVPCISIAYSQKAWGINEWLFGNNNWVVSAVDLTAKSLISRVGELHQQKEQVRAQLLYKSTQIYHETFVPAHRVNRILQERRTI